MYAHLQDEPPWLPGDEAADELDEVIARAMAKEPAIASLRPATSPGRPPPRQRARCRA